MTFPIALATLLLIPLVRRERKHGTATSGISEHFMLLGVAGQVVAQLFITWGYG